MIENLLNLDESRPKCKNQIHTTKISTTYPDFLKKRIESFYSERVEKSWGGKHILRSGNVPGPNAIQMMSNDYLSIADHPEIRKVQANSLIEDRDAVLMSGIFLQSGSIQHQFEEAMADFMKSDRTILSQSGWNANVGLIQSIATEGVPVYIDMLAHMSLWEGIHSASATARFFRHNDLDHLERKLKAHGSGIVVIDSVYSTNGSLAPIEEIVTLALAYNCVIIVDESHSLGTHGPEGRGLVVERGLEEAVHFRTASLAKAFAGRAGIVSCSEAFFDYFGLTSRPAIFSSALLPHEILGLHKTLEVIRRADQRRQQLHRNAQRLRNGLLAMGYNVFDSDSQIVSLEPGIESLTMKVRDCLEHYKIFGSIFAVPATPANRSLVRFSVNAVLSLEDIDQVLAVCDEIQQQVGLEDWASTKRLSRLLNFQEAA